MSDSIQAKAVDGQAANAHEHEQSSAHAHPNARKYLLVAMILTVLTAVEVGVYYVPSLKFMLAPTLLLLSAVKFSIVAAFYMHLKFDHRLFSALFVVPMVIAIAVIVALLGMFGAFHTGVH